MNFHPLALILILISASSFGTAVVSHPVRVFYGNGTQLVIRDLGDSELLRDWVKIRAKPPHRLVNPEQKFFSFEGPTLSRLLRGVALEHARFIYTIGADGYVTMIPSEVIRKFELILAFDREGSRLTPALGEQQVVFPAEPRAGALDPYRKKAAFWVWYVRAFVIGDLPNILDVGGRRIAMPDPGKNAPLVSYVPPSFLRADQKCPRVIEMPLSGISGLRGAAGVVARNLYRDHDQNAKPLEAVSGLRILRSTSSSAIPIECGGPFILVKPGKSPVHGAYAPDDLLYLVYGLDRAS